MAFDPRYLDFSRWAALTSQILVPLGFVARTVTEAQWKEWAVTVRQVPDIAPLQVPDPALSPDWQSWGFRLSEALQLLGL